MKPGPPRRYKPILRPAPPSIPRIETAARFCFCSSARSQATWTWSVTTFQDREAAVIQAMTGGAPPLAISAHKGHLPVVLLLLDRGADVNKAMTGGVIPLFFAAQEGLLPWCSCCWTTRLLITRPGQAVPPRS